MMISDEYAAGFFDADGSVYAARRTSRKGNSSPTLLICCTQAERTPGECPDVLAAHYDRWGGSLRPKNTREGCRKQWQWVLAPKAAADFLRAVYPYLIVKKKVAQKSLEFIGLQSLPITTRIDYTTRSVRKEHSDRVWTVHREICELNKKGLPHNALRKWDAN